MGFEGPLKLFLLMTGKFIYKQHKKGDQLQITHSVPLTVFGIAFNCISTAFVFWGMFALKNRYQMV